MKSSRSEGGRASGKIGHSTLPVFAALFAALALLLFTTPVRALDDYENTTPTAWWMDSSITKATLDNALVSRNARIVSLKYDNFSPFPFTAVMVENTGTYRKGNEPLWFSGLDEPTLRQKLTDGNGNFINRLVSLKAYDIGQGQIRFAGSMIPNTGADKKEWNFFSQWTGDQITQLTQTSFIQVRLTTLQSYSSNGQTFFAGIWIQNTGADAKAWWWFPSSSPQDINTALSVNNARLLDVTFAGNGTFNAVMEQCSGSCPMGTRWTWSHDQSFSDTQATAAQNNFRIISVDSYPSNGKSSCGTYCFVSVMLAGTMPGNHGSITPRLRGFVDLHTHLMGNLGFGGLLIYGGPDAGVVGVANSGSFLPHDPDCNIGVLASSIDQALGHDQSTHGDWNKFTNKCGNHLRELFIHAFQAANGAADESSDARGHPDYNEWPVWNDITHQKMWVDWIRRAYDGYDGGGLRVMVALAVNNKTLGDVVTGANIQPVAQGDTGLLTDDKSSADVQISSIKDFVSRHNDFMAIARSADELKMIVNSNKLAVILGVEIDKIGNFDPDPNSPPADADVAAEIQRLFDEGVRYVFPVHVLDNAFGGTAAYVSDFNYSNRKESGHWWDLACDSDGSIEHKITWNFSASCSLPSPSDVLHGNFAGLPCLVDTALALGPEWAVIFDQPQNYPNCYNYGQRNQAPITGKGELAIEKMMQHGMLIDLDHMSQNTYVGALSFVQHKVPGGYPLFSGHSDIRINGGSERNLRREDYLAIGNLHGMTGVGSANFDACDWTMQATKILQAMDFDPANPDKQNWAGIAFGTDTNGLAPGMKPSKSKTTSAAGDPVTMLTPNQQHIFYRDPQGDIRHVFWDAGQGKLIQTDPPWVGPGSLKKTRPAVGDPAAFNWQNQQQHLFFRDDQKNIWNYSWGLELWAGGSGSSNSGPAAAGNPVALITNNQQHMFYRDTSGNIWQVVWDESKNSRYPEQWTGPGGKTNGLTAVGDPAVMLWNSQQHIFYRDSQDQIEHVWYDPSGFGSWQKEIWGSGTGDSVTGPAAVGNPATMVVDNQQHIFYRSGDGSIWHVFWDDNQRARHAEPWAGPAAKNNTTKASGDPAAMAFDYNGQGFVEYASHQHIFYRDQTDNIVHVYYDKNSGKPLSDGNWTDAKVDPDSGTGPAALGDPVTMVWPASGTPAQQHIFYRSTGGGIWHVDFSSNGRHAEAWAPEQDPQSAASLASDKDFPEYCNYYRPPIPKCDAAVALPVCVKDFPFGQHTPPWNYDNDGVANYGMLPDFLQAVRTIPTGADLVDNNVMYGAEYLYQTWKFAEEQSKKVP